MPIACPNLPDTRHILENMRDSSDTGSFDILYCALVEPSRVMSFPQLSLRPVLPGYANNELIGVLQFKVIF